MGLFQQRSEEEEKAWAGLPAEPRGTEDPVDELPASDIDLFSVGLGAQTGSVVFPVPPPADEPRD